MYDIRIKPFICSKSLGGASMQLIAAIVDPERRWAIHQHIWQRLLRLLISHVVSHHGLGHYLRVELIIYVYVYIYI